MSDTPEPKHENEQDRSLLRWINETAERMWSTRFGAGPTITVNEYRFAQKLLLMGVKWGRENGPWNKASLNQDVYPVLKNVFDEYVPEFSERERLPDDWRMSSEADIPEETWMDIKLELCSDFDLDLLDAPLEHMTIGETVAYLENRLKAKAQLEAQPKSHE